MLFRPDAESPSEMALVGGNRRHHGLNINNSPNIKIYNIGDTGPLLGICVLEEGVSGICGASVAGGARFCVLSMDECNIASHPRSRGFRDELSGGKRGGVGIPSTI